MFLYNITLQRATGITHAIHGNFSGEFVPDVSSCLQDVWLDHDWFI